MANGPNMAWQCRLGRQISQPSCLCGFTIIQQGSLIAHYSVNNMQVEGNAAKLSKSKANKKVDSRLQLAYTATDRHRSITFCNLTPIWGGVELGGREWYRLKARSDLHNVCRNRDATSFHLSAHRNKSLLWGRLKISGAKVELGSRGWYHMKARYNRHNLSTGNDTLSLTVYDQDACQFGSVGTRPSVVPPVGRKGGTKGTKCCNSKAYNWFLISSPYIVTKVRSLTVFAQLPSVTDRQSDRHN
jgi:hypothetical protein